MDAQTPVPGHFEKKGAAHSNRGSLIRRHQ